jgi:formate dehydrogenase alpha subunit
MNSVKITINGEIYEVKAGVSLLHTAHRLGIDIPALCDHPDLTPYGGCRLCDVEIKGARSPMAACSILVSEGMEVQTETTDLVEARRHILQLLLSNYYDAGYATAGHNELVALCKRYAVPVARYSRIEPRYPVDSDPNPFIWVDLNKCILCTRCIRACAEIQGRRVWGLAERGFESRIVAGANVPMLTARCESCGACAVYCPTGALDHKLSMQLGTPDQLITTTCAYCGVGCNFDLNVKDGEVIRVTSNPKAPVNGQHLCVKGRYGYQYIHHPDRLTTPQVREYLLKGEKRQGKERGPWVSVDWDTALEIVATKLTQIRQESGPDAIGMLTSAKCTNEENFLMQKFSRQVIGTHNVDHCARLCHSSTVSGLAMSFGSGAMSNTVQDICENAKSIFIIGSNTSEQHPVIGSMIRQAVLQRGVKLIVADPRKVDIAEFSSLYLRQKPGTDVALINGLMGIILKNNWQDAKFIETRCENFAEFRDTVEKYTPEFTSQITGVSEDELYRAAEIMAKNHPMAVFWAMGITQHTTGVLNVLSLGNLQMLLGNMGIPGGGVNPLRGQNNVQGACDMGGLPNVFSGYQSVTNEAARQKFASAWQLEGDTPPSPLFDDKPGLTVTEMMPLTIEGKMRALYILGENPFMTDPDVNHTRLCLESCKFIALQEIFPSETADFADVLLPGVSYAEKTGTFTNTERRIQMVRQAVQSPGQSQPDIEIIAKLAQRILEKQNRQPVGTYAGWGYASASEVMAEIAALTPSYAGVNYARLNNGEQLHWPVKDIQHPGTPILHRGQFTRGKGRFYPTDHLPPQEQIDNEYPFILTTGRVLYHWHGGNMTRRSAALLEIYPETVIEINPEDAQKLGVCENCEVRVSSRRGECTAAVLVTDRVAPGVVFGNFHFPGDQNINNLTIRALDPVAKIPEYKVSAVKVELA